MPSYKLTYFNGRGRAEVTRIMCQLKGEKFEDARVDFGKPWEDLKPNTPFGQLPMLETDGITLCQSSAIERLFAKRLGLYGKDELQQAKADMVVGCGEDMLRAIMKVSELKGDEKEEAKKKCAEETLPAMFKNFEKMISPSGLFLDDKIMWPDISITHLLSFTDVYEIKIDLKEYPKLNALKQTVESQTNIEDWIKNRPKTGF